MVGCAGRKPAVRVGRSCQCAIIKSLPAVDAVPRPQLVPDRAGNRIPTELDRVRPRGGRSQHRRVQSRRGLRLCIGCTSCLEQKRKQCRKNGDQNKDSRGLHGQPICSICHRGTPDTYDAGLCIQAGSGDFTMKWSPRRGTGLLRIALCVETLLSTKGQERSREE